MVTSADKTQPPIPLWTVRLEQPAKQTPIMVDNCLFVATQSANRGARHIDCSALARTACCPSRNFG